MKRRPRGSTGRRPSLKWEMTADRSEPQPNVKVASVIWVWNDVGLLPGHAGTSDHQPV